MICHNCNNRDDCIEICDKVNNALYAKHPTCSHDIGVYCTAGDPNGLYHPDCDDIICKDYCASPNIQKEVNFVKYYKEFSFANDYIDKISTSIYSVGEIVSSGGFVQLVPYQSEVNVSDMASLFRRYVQRFLIENPMNMLTTSQTRAMRLYFSLITRKSHSLGDVAVVMRVSKMRIVHHISVALSKIKSFMIFNIVGDIMNGATSRFEEFGVRFEISKPMDFDQDVYDKVRNILTNECSGNLLTRDQFQVLWLFCGCHNNMYYSVGEIAEILDTPKSIISKRISTGVSRINKYIIDKLLDVKDTRICAARDCNNVYEVTHKDKIYCSAKCRNREKERRYRENKAEEDVRICPTCGIKFSPNRETQRYHNRKCKGRHDWHNANDRIQKAQESKCA